MNQILSISITFILWQAYAYLEGMRDGYYYHALNGKESKNMHPIYTSMRMIFGTSLIFWCNESWANILLTFFMSSSFICVFSFWHNCKYYETRHILNNNVYPKGWSSTSTTSRATFDLSFNQRCWGLVIGILFFVGAVINVLINR